MAIIEILISLAIDTFSKLTLHGLAINHDH